MMVTLVWGGGEEVLGEPPPPLVFNHSKDALLIAHDELINLRYVLWGEFFF